MKTDEQRERLYAQLRARYARDLARQREKNGGRTDAEVYKEEHERALRELYRRASLVPTEEIRRN